MALNQDFILPGTIATGTDLAQVRMELERINEQMLQDHLRAPDKVVTVPRTSRRLSDSAAAAGLKLQESADREALLKLFEVASKSAPRVRISFAANPSDEFLSKIVTWFRENIHAQVLFTVGLQPSIAAGFVMQTSSKYFDCSIRKHFNDRKSMLADALKVPVAS